MSKRSRLGGIIHTYQKYDPQRFPSPTKPPPDLVSPALEHLLHFGSTRRLTEAELARAVRLDPSQIRGLGPNIDALLAMLLERKRKILQRYETETVQRTVRRNYYQTGSGLRPPKRLQRQFLRLAPDIARVGKWLGEYEPTVEMTGRFDAITDGLTAPLEYDWWVNRMPLSSGRGTVDVGGLAMRYEVSGARLLLKATKKQPVTAEIRVAVDDANGYRAETARCFEYKPKCLRRARVIPTWNIYREAYMKNFGIRESKIAAMAVPIEKTNIQRRKH